MIKILNNYFSEIEFIPMWINVFSGKILSNPNGFFNDQMFLIGKA